MKKQKRVLKLLLGYGLLLNPVKGLAFDWWNFGKAISVAVAGVTAAVCTASAIDWLATPSDYALTTSIPAECRKIYARHAYWIDLWNSNKPDEAFLYELAIANWNSSLSWSTYSGKLWSDANTMNNHYRALCKRVNALESSNRRLTHQEYSYLREMRALIIELEPFIDRINVFYNYLNKHSVFFELAQTEWRINADYTKDTELFNFYYSDPYRLAQELDILIGSRYLYERFPYINYVKNIESAIKMLEEARSRVSAYAYPNRVDWTERILRTLKQIRIAVDYRYHLQLLEKQRQDLERERIALQAERHRLIMEQEIERWNARSYQLELQCTELQNQITSMNNSSKVSFTISAQI